METKRISENCLKKDCKFYNNVSRETYILQKRITFYFWWRKRIKKRSVFKRPTYSTTMTTNGQNDAASGQTNGRWVLRVDRRILREDKRVLRVGKRVLRVLRVVKQLLQVTRRVVQILRVTRRVLW